MTGKTEDKSYQQLEYYSVYCYAFFTNESDDLGEDMYVLPSHRLQVEI